MASPTPRILVAREVHIPRFDLSARVAVSRTEESSVVNQSLPVYFPPPTQKREERPVSQKVSCVYSSATLAPDNVGSRCIYIHGCPWLSLWGGGPDVRQLNEHPTLDSAVPLRAWNRVLVDRETGLIRVRKLKPGYSD